MGKFEAAAKMTETGVLDFSENIAHHLLSGWSIPEAGHRWAVGLHSEVEFISAPKEGVSCTIHCHPFAVQSGEQQRMKVFLNSVFLEEFALQSDKGAYRVALPKRHFKKGTNRLRFEFAYARSPREENVSVDARKLAVMFKKIAFHGPENRESAIFRQDGAVVQTPGTKLCFYEAVPSGTRLALDFVSARDDMNVKVTVDTDRKPSQSYIVQKSGKHEIDLTPFAPGPARLSFGVEAPEADPSQSKTPAMVRWRGIELIRSRGNPRRLKISNKTDVIYIVLDAFYAGHSSLYGYHRETTPFLDRWAREALVFDQMFANAPYTLASTATLFTSRFTPGHHLATQENRMSPEITTLPEFLSQQDIRTCMVTDHPYLSSPFGLDRGFDYVYDKHDYRENPGAVIDVLKQIYAQPEEKRRFIYIHLIPPHGPYMPPEKYRVYAKHKPGLIMPDETNVRKVLQGEIELSPEQVQFWMDMYDANILYADDIARMIMSYLEDSGIAEKAVIAVTSDHGEAFNQHGRLFHNSTVFEEMVHIPLLIRFPSRFGLQPRRIDTQVSVADMAPTLCRIFNLEISTSYLGRDIMPLILGGNIPHQPVYMETTHRTGGMRGCGYKFIDTRKVPSLYDLQKDPDEKMDVYAQSPITRTYFQRLMAIHKSSGGQTFKNGEIPQSVLDKLKTLGYIKSNGR